MDMPTTAQVVLAGGCGNSHVTLERAFCTRTGAFGKLDGIFAGIVILQSCFARPRTMPQALGSSRRAFSQMVSEEYAWGFLVVEGSPRDYVKRDFASVILDFAIYNHVG